MVGILRLHYQKTDGGVVAIRCLEKKKTRREKKGSTMNLKIPKFQWLELQPRL